MIHLYYVLFAFNIFWFGLSIFLIRYIIILQNKINKLDMGGDSEWLTVNTT